MYQLIHFCFKVYLFSFYSKTKNAKDTDILQSLYNHYISISPPKGTLPKKHRNKLILKIHFI